MVVAAAIFGFLLLLAVLWDTFVTIVLPRTVEGGARISALFYRLTWAVWSRLARGVSPRRRESFLVIFGPLSLILLIGLWATLLVVAFGLINFGLEIQLTDGEGSLPEMLYYSGVLFFTLGLGDLTPVSGLGRTLAVGETGTGFAFLALVIGYLPVLYQSFSRREVAISLLDARAGSPPTAVEFLSRHAESGHPEELHRMLVEWEHWAAELLESYLSYPVLAYYRSQHERQSWLAAVTAVMDTCALIDAGFVDGDQRPGFRRQAQLTFAMTRHAVVDLALILDIKPDMRPPDRLPPADAKSLRERLAKANVHVPTDDGWEQRLKQTRGQYEPYLHSIGRNLLLDIPAWLPEQSRRDNWQVSAWDADRHF